MTATIHKLPSAMTLAEILEELAPEPNPLPQWGEVDHMAGWSDKVAAYRRSQLRTVKP